MSGELDRLTEDDRRRLRVADRVERVGELVFAASLAIDRASLLLVRIADRADELATELRRRTFQA